MKNNKIVKSVGLTVNKIGFKMQQHSPEILIVTGIIGVVASTVVACKATIKATSVAEETRDTVNKIHEAKESGVTEAGSEYSADDAKKDLATVYIQTGVKYAKMYAPAVILGGVSITCILASHRILKKRNVAIAAAYAATDKAFKDYRDRVVERFGEQVEKELRYNIKAKEVTDTIVDEKGKEKSVKEIANVAEVDGWDPSQYSPYARIFDETHKQWNMDPEMNMFYLKARQAQATDMLRSRGHLFLNEVYDMLNFPRTKMGAVVGWLYDPKNPELGDTYVDFGLYEVRRPKAVDFGNGYERSIILDFNARGDITDEISTHQFI